MNPKLTYMLAQQRIAELRAMSAPAVMAARGSQR